jgi:hypothetical protein
MLMEHERCAATYAPEICYKQAPTVKFLCENFSYVLRANIFTNKADSINLVDHFILDDC